MSPYFFNSAKFSTGQTLGEIGIEYAMALKRAEWEFDVVYAPPYKGIPLATATVIALNDLHVGDYGFATSRKEEKDHGEGGIWIGASVEGKRVVIVDDVITRGDAKREAFDLIKCHGGIPVGIAIAFDRQERGIDGALSASQEAERHLHIPVVAIATTQELIHYLHKDPRYADELAAIKAYQREYGAANSFSQAPV
jgi:orotate phosphoribosyltransferase